MVAHAVAGRWSLSTVFNWRIERRSNGYLKELLPRTSIGFLAARASGIQPSAAPLGANGSQTPPMARSNSGRLQAAGGWGTVWDDVVRGSSWEIWCGVRGGKAMQPLGCQRPGAWEEEGGGLGWGEGGGNGGEGKGQGVQTVGFRMVREGREVPRGEPPPEDVGEVRGSTGGRTGGVPGVGGKEAGTEGFRGEKKEEINGNGERRQQPRPPCGRRRRASRGEGRPRSRKKRPESGVCRKAPTSRQTDHQHHHR